MYYKDLQGALHYLDGISFEYLLPAGCVAITDAEAQTILTPTLAQIQAAQIALLQAAYQAAIEAPVSYTTVTGTTAIFAQDAISFSNLQKAITGATETQTWPLDLWLDVNGIPVTPFTFVDLEKLASAMEAVDVPDYSILLSKVSAVRAATSVHDVQDVVW